jgi:hypothetical protein
MTIKLQFEEMLRSMFGDKLPQVGTQQRQQLEQAFYGGYVIAFATMVELAGRSDRESLAGIAQLERELKDYGKLIGCVPRALFGN